METYLERINHVELHLKNEDINLAFRLLTDCVIDTNHLNFYRKLVALANWEEAHPNQKSEFGQHLQALADELKTFDFESKFTGETLMSTSGLTKNYGRFKLSDVSIDICQGEVWGLVGENGNGKTTLLRMLSGDLEPSSGTLSYPFSKHKSHYNLRTDLVYIPQRTAKHTGSILNHLKFTAAQYKYRGEHSDLISKLYLIRLGLWSFRELNWSQLSSGYKMRFELAKTLVRHPKILILDEPLANLDVLSQQLILEDLKNISQSLSRPLGVILSSQQLFEVEKIATNVLFLKKGQPTLLNQQNNDNQSTNLIVELEIECKKHELEQILNQNNELVSIQFNGGMYIVELANSTFKSFLLSLCQSDFEVKYIRDISHSSRRLFTS